MEITDAVREVLIEQKVAEKQGILVFNSSNYPQGILVCHLFCDDEIIFSKKIISLK